LAKITKVLTICTRPGFLAGVVALLFGLVIWIYGFYFPSRIGPEQPIPFSHRVHAGKKKIGCLLCHEHGVASARAGMPPVETCMLCHSRIIITFPWIQKVRDYYFNRQPIAWIKVFYLPEFVYFNHSVHLDRSIDCGWCHGDIKAMDRVEAVQEFTMGFCTTCHRKYGATTDCFTCHR